VFLDDEEVERFIDREFAQYRRTFDLFKVRIQLYEFFRYLVVCWFGGFYLDVLVTTGFSNLRNASWVSPFEGLTFSR
jgi:mannosyltransferase OCH1-like enzyme